MDNASLHPLNDWAGAPLPSDSPLLAGCRASVSFHLRRHPLSPPRLRIDPLTPLPLADAARPKPAARFVYFVLASRPYAHETINRNVRALQRPGALDDVGTNESNVFLLHADAKMAPEDQRLLRSRVHARGDVYWIRQPRAVMWAGSSMVLALLDVMASLLKRPLAFEYLINLSDADLTLRTHYEIRNFFGRYPGRSIMSLVPRARDPRRYRMHEGFRKYCWLECDGGNAWVVGSASGEALNSQKVIGKSKCCWSRSAPILYTRTPISCANGEGPDVFHGSQWASLHHSLVRHMVEHPTAQRVARAMEHTLLPDEALLQTMAVNSAHRSRLIANHLRFIEWPQLHGDANKYWASLGPRFHGGPMVLNVSLASHKAFLTSAMFARKFDPTVYADVLPVWDSWMANKLASGGLGPNQPPIANSLTSSDPMLRANIPPATQYEAEGRDNGGGGGGSGSGAGEHAHAHGHGHDDPNHDDYHDHGHQHEEEIPIVGGLVLLWVLGVLCLAVCLACAAATGHLRRRLFGKPRPRPEADSKSF